MKFAVQGLLIAALAASSLAAVEVEEPSQLIVEVKGIVCSFCAYGARKNLARVDFLDRSKFKDGLLMKTERGLITAAIQEGAKADFSQVFKAIGKGGYEILAVHVNLVGAPEMQEGKTVLTHAFTRQEFALVDDQDRPWEAGDFQGKEVSIQGMVPGAALEGLKGPAVPVQVKSAKPAEKAGETP